MVFLIHPMADGLGINVFMLSLYASSYLGNVMPYSYRSMPKAHQCESREAFRSLVEENTNAKSVNWHAYFAFSLLFGSWKTMVPPDLQLLFLHQQGYTVNNFITSFATRLLSPASG
jgi:hypothetical protein